MANYTILLIDYEPRCIEMLREPLVEAGFDVEVAKDGELGVEAFERCLPDLTLVEAMLPKLHGFDVCRRLKATEHGRASAVVIMTSIYRKAAHRRQAHECGADGCLQKPMAADDLLTDVLSFLKPTPALAESKASAADSDEAPSEAHLDITSRLDALFG